MSLEQEESCENIPPNHLCTKCHLSYKSSNFFEMHLQNYPTRCVCRVEFISECGYQQHFRKAKDSESFHCCCCWDSFETQWDLKRHLFQHGGHRQSYTCEHCDENFFCFENLASHDFINRDENEHVCGICRAVFKRSCFLKKHQIISHLQTVAPQSVECTNWNTYVTDHSQATCPSGFNPMSYNPRQMGYFQNQRLCCTPSYTQVQAANHVVELPLYQPKILSPTNLTNQSPKHTQSYPQRSPATHTQVQANHVVELPLYQPKILSPTNLTNQLPKRTQSYPQRSPASQVHIPDEPVEALFYTSTLSVPYQPQYLLPHHVHQPFSPSYVDHHGQESVFLPSRNHCNHHVEHCTAQTLQNYPPNPAAIQLVQYSRAQRPEKVQTLPSQNTNKPRVWQSQHFD